MEQRETVAELERFLLLQEAERVIGKTATSMKSKQAEREHMKFQDQITRTLPAIEQIARLLDPDQISRLRQTTYGWPWQAVKEATLRLLGIAERLGKSDEPTLSPGAFHSWVWSAGSKYWTSGSLKAAVQAAATAIDEHLQFKVDRYDISGTDLVRQVFRKDEPEPGQPRLRFAGLRPDSQTFKNAHDGAMNFGAGCFMRIRNQATHTTNELERQVALEQLASLSLLARWINEAEVVRAE